MGTSMKESVGKMRLSHVLGDCYCDDWKFAQDSDTFMEVDGDVGGSYISNKGDIGRATMRSLGKLMLTQAQPGSIAIFHMPERGFREGTIHTLEEFLRGAQ